MTVTKAGHGDQPQRAAAAAAETSALSTRPAELPRSQPWPYLALLIPPTGIPAVRKHLASRRTARSGDNFTARALGPQGLDSKVAEAKCWRLPAILGEGGPGDPVDDWTHECRALAGGFSVQQPVVDRTCPGLQPGQVAEHAVAAQVIG
jgi:hypothetical protein